MTTNFGYQTARILIVDDHPNTASMLARVLGTFDTPVEVMTARSGEEALSMVGDKRVDVLITDFIMPGMNGLDLIEKLSGDREPGYKILITAYETPGIEVSAKKLNINDFLIKPVQPDKIREIVSGVINNFGPNGSAGATGGLQANVFKILVADDYPDNVMLLTRRLNSEGYQSISAMDGVEALQKIRAEHPDLVLLDINMPRKNGFEVLAEMRTDPDISYIPVIVITAARIGVKDVQQGLTLGADDYITKPVDWRELSARIHAKLRVKKAEDELRQRNRQLQSLPEVNRDMGGNLDLEALTIALLDRTVKALQAENGYLVVFHPDGNVAHQMHKLIDFSPWTWDDVQRRIVSEGVVVEVIMTRDSLLIEDTTQYKSWLKIPNDLARSAICVPLLSRQDVLGVLMLTHGQPGYFKSNHLELVKAVASQAAVAFENVHLYAAERKRVSELVSFNKMTQEISQHVRSNELFNLLPELIRESLGYPAVGLWLLEGGAPKLHHLAGELDAPTGRILSVAAEQAANLGRAVQISGAVEDRISFGATSTLSQAQSAIAVPLIWQGKVGGVLSAYSMKSGAFQESDRVLMEAFASQVGTVLERIWLFESVEREQKRLNTVLESAADAILVFDENGNMQLANGAGKRLFTNVDTCVGQPIPIDHGYDALLDLLGSTARNGVPAQGEIIWPDERTFSVLVAPIEEGGQVVVLHDVSNFKALDQLKNEFIATASHDLKNPIFAVMGYSDLIEKAGPINAMQGDFIRRIRNSATQMQDLVLNLLEMARLDMGIQLEQEPVDMFSLLKEVYDEFLPQAQAKGHSLTITLPDRKAVVSGDYMRLLQVGRNLVGNAIKYTPAGGKINIRSEVKGKIVYVMVLDNGIGIPAEALPNLFEKFYRIRTEQTQDIEGNGLGLAIVKSIIERHGGRITVESLPGKGSCFSFYLAIQDRSEIDHNQESDGLSSRVVPQIFSSKSN